MTLKTLARQIIDRQRLFDEQQELLARCARIVVQQKEELNELKLEHFREIHGMVCGWLISLETPEDDPRPSLIELEAQLGSQIARLEEHIVR